jgi:phage baseplate assembly protein V
MLNELKNRIKALESIVMWSDRVGKVTNVYPDKGTVRVEIADIDNVKSYELPVIFQKTHKDCYYCMPDIHEHVLVKFLPNGLEQGFVMGAFYSASDIPPVKDPDKHHIKFVDGSFIEYDRKTHELHVSIKGTIKIDATGDIKINSDTHHVTTSPRIDHN